MTKIIYRRSLFENAETSLGEELFQLTKNEIARIDDYLYESKEQFFPDWSEVFRAFEALGPFKQVKVILLGQDPYPNSSATGLAFEVRKGCAVNGSVKMLLKEVSRTYDTSASVHDLSSWAKQGVLLINASLTVRKDCANSHANLWKEFMRIVMEYYSHNSKILWLAMGIKAEKIISKIEGSVKLVAPHPSPNNTTKPFANCGIFEKANKILDSPIKW